MATRTRNVSRSKRHERIRQKIRGTTARPRLVVFRSITHIYAQLVDDARGRTVAAASDLDAKSGSKSDRAKSAGTSLAERAKQAGVTEVVFDRGGYRYHGRVKALADAARAGGLKF
jgi:large subunit ribosomal protein L18